MDSEKTRRGHDDDDDSHRKSEHRGRDKKAHKKRRDRDEESPKNRDRDGDKKKRKRQSEAEIEAERYEAEREKQDKRIKEEKKNAERSKDKKNVERSKDKKKEEKTPSKKEEKKTPIKKKVKFSDSEKGSDRKKDSIPSRIIRLPEKLSRVNTAFKINIANGEAKLTYRSGDYLSKQAVDYCMNMRVFERPIWPSKRESTTKNPEIGALICRWVAKTSEKKKNADAGDKGKKKPFIKFEDADQALRDEILMDTE